MFFVCFDMSLFEVQQLHLLLTITNTIHRLPVPESRFDHDSEESGEEMEDDEEDEEDEEEEEEEDEVGEGDPTPHSQTHSRSQTPEENYIPDSPPISPVELKKELPKYMPALQVHEADIYNKSDTS